VTSRSTEDMLLDPTDTWRRIPVQQRSRARVERMLDVAARLIAERGSDALRMCDVAEGAEVSIGSLYQYFPDKSAIVRTLAERFNAIGQECVAREFQDVRDDGDLRQALIRATDGYYAIFREEPVMRDIWSGTQADRTLQDLAVADVRAHAALLATSLRALRPRADPKTVEITSLLLMQMLDATVRLAISVESEEGDQLIDAFKRSVISSFKFI